MGGVPVSPLARLLLSVAVGLAAGLLSAVLSGPVLGVLAGITAAAGLFLVSGVAALWPMDPETTQRNAVQEDYQPVLEEISVVAATIASLAAIAFLLAPDRPAAENAAAAVGLAGVFMNWAVLHLMYTARYAHLYYAEPAGGIDFNHAGHQPSYRDFFYFSYTVGMSYAVADNNVSSTAVRAMVLRHAVLSFIFGTVILAATINLVAGIVTG